MKNCRVNTINNKIWSAEQVYLVMFASYLLVAFLETTSFLQYFSFDSLNHISYIFAFVVLGKMYLMDGLDKFQLLLRTSLLIIAFLSWRESHSNQIFLMMVFILGASNVSFNQIIRWFYWIEMISILCVITFSLLGIIQNYIYHPSERAIRFSLGITYPTDLSAHILFLLLAHCYINYRKLNVKHYIAYFVISVVMLAITNGRLSFICELGLVLACLIAKLAERGLLAAKLITACYWAVAPILALLMFILSYLYSPNNFLLNKMNRVLSGRLALGHEALQKGIHLFGQYVHENGLGGPRGMAIFLGHSHLRYFYIDSSYLRLFIIYGLLMGTVVLAFLVVIGFRATIHTNYPLMIAILIIGFSCCVEQHLLDISYNPFLLSLFAIPSAYLEDTYEKIQLTRN